MKLKKKIILFILLIIIGLQTFSYANTPNINSQAGILVEVSTGRILYEKNSTKQMYPASTTKIMTAILVIENCELSDIVTVSQTALNSIPTGYVTSNLQVGEELSVKDLLYVLMVPSANDAACVLAEHIAGSVEKFANMMNTKAEELGCTGTHFVNPNGIHNNNHYSTAYDLYLIANYCMKNEIFRQIVKATEYTLPATNLYKNTDRVFSTTNELINPNSKNYYYKNAIGIKTGFTSQAGNCLVSEASRDGLEFISVVLKGGATNSGLNARYADSKKLFDYAYDNFTLTKIIEKSSIIDTIEIENATKETKNLDIIIDQTITVVNNKNIDINSVIPEIALKENLEAPIASRDVVGTIKYKVDDIEYSANLLAKSNVEKKNYLYVFIIIIVLFLLFIGSIMIKGKKKKLKKKRK